MPPITEADRKRGMDLELLKTFLEIVRMNSFRSAARIRKRSQPAVTARIEVALTPTGAIFAR